MCLIVHRLSHLCRILFGEVEAASYDWLNGAATRPNAPQPAVLGSSGTHTGSEENVLALYPEQGNLHALEARKPAAILDVLIPGYVEGMRVALSALRGLANADTAALQCSAAHMKGKQLHCSLCSQP